jgi:hypothetical protein
MLLSLRTLLIFLAAFIAAEIADKHPTWLANYPALFHHDSLHVFGNLLDVSNDSTNITKFKEFSDYFLARVDGFTDGEVVDALEHFFWGKRNGLAMELGALDGSSDSKSMTVEYERNFGWNRILVEGDPKFRLRLQEKSPLAFSANAAICEQTTTVHFSTGEFIGGILEFMSDSFMKEYHGSVYNRCVPPGNISSLNFAELKLPSVIPVDCMPLSTILHKARVTHINFFILDVEGGELQVLKSINWDKVQFDVLCVETEPSNRPPGYAASVTEFLAVRGYTNATQQQGRNIWYVHKGFEPSVRPGLDAQCYNGARKSDHAERWYANRRTPAYQRCPGTS